MSIPSKKLIDGIKIPLIGIGTWQLEGETCINAIKKAFEIGYRHIDTAYIYSNHKEIRQGIEGFPREELFITSKLWREHLEPEMIEKVLDEALLDLGTDYLDLYLIHWPDTKKPLNKILRFTKTSKNLRMSR